MWHKHKVSVALLTHNHRATIRDYIESLFYTGFVDEVLVVDAGSQDDTISEVSYTRARIISADDLNMAMRLAVERASGSLIIFGDPAGNIPARDVVKLLPYADMYDFVGSSRLLWIGESYAAADKPFVKDHLLFGSLISKTFETVSFTDLASPLFLFKRETFQFAAIKFTLQYRYAPFEIMLDALAKGKSVIQVPVEFHAQLAETDTGFFGSFRMRHLLKSKIKHASSRISKESRDAVQKKNAIAHAVGDIVRADDNSEDVDPEWVRRRIRDIQKRLGSVNRPYVEKQIQDEVNAAIESVVAGNKPKKTKTEEKPTLEEQYTRLEQLDAGLSKKKRTTKRKK